MKVKLSIGIGVVLLSMNALTYAADQDTIDSVSSDGENIIMQSGTVYQSDDPATSSTWNSGDDVVITNDDKIINVDEGGESVYGTEE